MHNRTHNKWEREGDFYQITHIYETPVRKVIFRYVKCFNRFDPRTAILKSITIEKNASAPTAVYFYFSPIHRSAMFAVLREIFDEVEICEFHFKVSIQHDFMSRLDRFIRYHAEINEQFTPDIIDELRNIMAFQYGKPCEMRHKLERIDEYISRAYVNPAYKNSRELSDLLMTYNGCHGTAMITNKMLGKRIHQLLIRGEDPNQSDSMGWSCLTQIIQYFAADLELIKLFLMYGGNFLEADTFTGQTPLEYALQQKRYKAYDYLNNTMIKVSKPISSTNPLMSVVTIAGTNKIITNFQFATSWLMTSLKPTNDLTDDELAGLYKIFQQRCEGNKGFQLIFAKEADRLVDLIRADDNEIVGCVVYKVKMANEKIWVDIDFELFTETRPNFGIMPVITYRFPFCLQLLYPGTEIWMVFFSAHYKSFMRVKSQLALPKYQPPGKVREVADTLKNNFECQFDLIHDERDGTVCSVTESDPVTIKDEEKTETIDIMEELYRRFRGEINDRRRQVLVSLPVASDFLATLQIIAANKEVNFYRVIYDLSTQLARLGMGNNSPKHPYSPGFFASAPLFWLGEKIPDRKLKMPDLAQLPRHKSGMTHKL